VFFIFKIKYCVLLIFFFSTLNKAYYFVTTQRIISVRTQVIDFSGICNMVVAVERTWMYLQRPEKSITCVLFKNYAE